MSASAEGSAAFRVADVAVENARLRYERAFEAYVEDRERDSLFYARTLFREWKDLIQLRMQVAYFEHYHVHSHSPGAP